MKNLSIILTLTMSVFFKNLLAQESITLYPDGIPNQKTEIETTNKVEFYYYKPEVQKSDKIFLIVPGGGYSRVAMGHEGHDVAKRLKDLGYVSFVLRYRLPVENEHVDKRVVPLQDAQYALLYIKRNAKKLGYTYKQVGVLGFSAGGHLASTLSTHYLQSQVSDKIKKNELRPDFSILVYPVITMDDKFTHKGSKTNLIGPNFKDEDVLRFSNEKNINKDTPPAYFVHAVDDKAVPIENSYLYQKELSKNNIPNDLYKYEKGGHGFGMVNKQEDGDWFSEMIKWINKLK